MQLLTWVLRDDETGSIEMAVPRVLPGSPIEEIHRKGGIGDCIFGKETATSKLNGAAVHLSLRAAVFYVVKKPISICGRLNNAPSIPSLVYWLEKKKEINGHCCCLLITALELLLEETYLQHLVSIRMHP